MIHFIFWYLAVSFVGLVAYPVLSRLLPRLPERGYIFARVFGLISWGYLYWLLGVLGFLDNSILGLLLTLLILGGASAYVLSRQGWENFLPQLKQQRSLVITVEVMFLVAFAAWAYVRSLNPDIVGTEKPMELAFINAILRSDSFPPHDPWLAGYGISYYYFGYVMVAMLAKLTGTSGGVAFNLGVSLVFALSALGSYGVVYYLIHFSGLKKRLKPAVAALLGPFFTLIVSNWEGFLHWLHARGVFWRQDALGQWQSRFWSWLNIQDLVSPPSGQSFGHWWWWRASRVIQDIDFQGNGKEVISEFPFFSYLLGDLHPHVLAMPFAFFVMALGLWLFLSKDEDQFKWLGFLPVRLSLPQFVLVSFAVGSLTFLNTWDFPIYAALLSGAYALRDVLDREDWHVARVAGDFFSFGIAAGFTGLLFFLPFLIGFDSQAGGLIPNLIYITPGSQLWVMFGPLFLPLFAVLIYLWINSKKDSHLGHGLWFMVALILGLLVLALIIVAVIPLIPPLQGMGPISIVYLNSIGAPGLRQAIIEGFRRRLMTPGTLLTLGVLGTLAFSLLWKAKGEESRIQPGAGTVQPAYPFLLLLVLGGMILVLVPEFVYLRDLFGYRINTIFKFYFQAWLMWSVAAAFGTLIVFQRIGLPWGGVIRGVLVLSLAAALVYPLLSIRSRTNNFQPLTGKTLDGAAQFREFSPHEAQAAGWLKEAPFGVIAESVGGSYSSHARMATYSGLPTILGWDFHEIQWRGGSELVNPRREDVRNLYCTPDWGQAQAILGKYDVRYVVVGQLEYSTYVQNPDTCPGGLEEQKFANHMNVVFHADGVTIYGK